jgi:hypothetical protein
VTNDSFIARPQVRVVPHGGVQVPSLGVTRRSPVRTGASPTRWIVRSTAFALLDLVLLVSGGHH